MICLILGKSTWHFWKCEESFFKINWKFVIVQNGKSQSDTVNFGKKSVFFKNSLAVFNWILAGIKAFTFGCAPWHNQIGVEDYQWINGIVWQNAPLSDIAL